MPNTTTKPVPDCTTCRNYEECARAKDGTFCPKWQSREVKKNGKDPNELWRRGEEADF